MIMRRLISLQGRLLARWVVLFLGGVLALGCASSQSTQLPTASQAAVIGTWEYEVEGIAPLDEGTFYITRKNGRLQALVRDRRWGRLQAQVDLDDTRLELSVEDLEISGYIEDEQFSAFLRRDQWGINTRRRITSMRPRSRFQSVSLYARRIRSATVADTPSILDCESLLRETDECS